MMTLKVRQQYRVPDSTFLEIEVENFTRMNGCPTEKEIQILKEIKSIIIDSWNNPEHIEKNYHI